MDDVIDAFEIGTVIMPDKTHTSQTFLDVLRAVQKKKLGDYTGTGRGDVSGRER